MFEGRLKRNADFRFPPPLGLFILFKRHRSRENGLPGRVEAPGDVSRPCRLSIVPDPIGLTVAGTISVPPRSWLRPHFETLASSAELEAKEALDAKKCVCLQRKRKAQIMRLVAAEGSAEWGGLGKLRFGRIVQSFAGERVAV